MTQFLLFGSPTCQPCKAVKDMFEAQGFEFDYVDCEETPEVAAEHMVMSTPTMIELNENNEEIDRAVGQGKVFAMSQK